MASCTRDVSTSTCGGQRRAGTSGQGGAGTCAVGLPDVAGPLYRQGTEGCHKQRPHCNIYIHRGHTAIYIQTEATLQYIYKQRAHCNIYTNRGHTAIYIQTEATLQYIHVYINIYIWSNPTRWTDFFKY